jgi:cytochrome c peroxidase
LADEAAHPLTGSNEMGQTYERIIDYLGSDRSYRDAFKEVFPLSLYPARIYK